MMRTSATGPRNRRSPGFSLVELMVVMVILALAGGAVMLTVPAPQVRLEAQAQALASHLARAREEAILRNHPVALRVEATGYAFSLRRAGRWEALAQPPFGERRFGQDIHAVFDPDQGLPRFEFDATGDTEGGSVVLAAFDDALRVAVDAEGRLSVGPAQP
jgi:general secretion pathway protein H